MQKITLTFIPVEIDGQMTFRVTDQNNGDYDHILSSMKFSRLSGNFFEASMSFYFEDERGILPDSYSADADSYPKESK